MLAAELQRKTHAALSAALQSKPDEHPADSDDDEVNAQQHAENEKARDRPMRQDNGAEILTPQQRRSRTICLALQRESPLHKKPSKTRR